KSYILTSNSIMNSIVATDSFTLVLWIYFKGQSVSGNWNGAISGMSSLSSTGIGFVAAMGGGTNTPPKLFVSGTNTITAPSTIPENTWEMLTASYNGSTGSAIIYLNSQQLVSGTLSANIDLHPSTTNIEIGDDAWSSGTDSLNGMLANIQIYNTSLSGPAVNALYDEGIGGAPIKLQNLVGWWPLNGNANDYSGNNNNGVPSGVTYTNQWTSGYTTP
ncbi:MAG: LamG domain-containing protein, partial [Candidatus Marsarchaeota archaeon]|nr:LamG domain-containing protein [Candidatus Marsarchaeota archaeon]